MRLAALIAALSLAGTVQAYAATPKEAPVRPNVLVVITDDQAAEGTLDVMRQVRRRIGRQGVTFEQAYVTTPKCCPSRASFFTGRYVHNHGVISNANASDLPHDQTVHYLLRKRGYRTAIFGKFLNSWPVEVDPPFFDEWAISNAAGRENEVFWNINSRFRTKDEYTTDLIARRALGFIRRADRRDDDQPWLAWVTPHAPHWPSVPAPRHRNRGLPAFPLTPAMQETDWSDKPDFLEAARNNDATLLTVRDDGRRSLFAVDEMVGRLLDEIKARGEVDNTLVVFTSDNGFMFGEHGGVVGKDLPYPAATHVPLLARWPGHFRRGRTNSKFVTNIDVAATLLEAAGLGKRETDGRSLFASGRRTDLFVESRGSYNEDGARALPAFRSVMTDDYRYAEYYRNGSYDLLFREYYDLNHDPWELTNVVSALDSARVGELSATLEQYGTCRGRACP